MARKVSRTSADWFERAGGGKGGDWRSRVGDGGELGEGGGVDTGVLANVEGLEV